MNFTLDQILALVGTLDDLAGNDTPCQRFRSFLKNNVSEIGQVRDYIEDCLREPGNQYNRALQDLVNHLGHFLKFEVTFGRYQGVKGQIGFDGYWKSPTGFHLVVEVKTTEVYAVKTTALLGYVDSLISEHQIPSWDQALGLYIVGRPDPEIRQLENAIIAEKRTHQLRVISVGSLLSLAEMMNEYDIGHEDILAVLRPSGPLIDTVVDLMARMVAEPVETQLPEKAAPVPQMIKDGEVTSNYQASTDTQTQATYWMTPVKSDGDATAEEVIEALVKREKIYAFGERTPGRRYLKPGDWMCFYAAGTGVVAHAQVASAPEEKPHPKVRHADKYPWIFQLKEPKLYLTAPIVIDADLRSRLDAFQGRDPTKAWAWFVQATRKITARDFAILTRQPQTVS